MHRYRPYTRFRGPVPQARSAPRTAFETLQHANGSWGWWLGGGGYGQWVLVQAQNQGAALDNLQLAAARKCPGVLQNGACQQPRAQAEGRARSSACAGRGMRLAKI